MMSNKAGKFVLQGSIALTALLTVLCVLGAFAGPVRAKVFFNSPQMIVFWCVFLLLLAAGFLFSPAMRRRKTMLLIHAGVALVLAGGMYGSQTGHTLLAKAGLPDRFTRAILTLEQGQTLRVAFSEDERPIELPFAVHLKEAVIEYYDQSPMVKDYFSEIEIIVDNQVVKEGLLEVNAPLYYDGYHIYQSTFGFHESVPVSGLLIVSSQGIGLVFGGYLLTGMGLIGLVAPIVSRRKQAEAVL